ncbi:MAG: hypothetical protein VX498_09715 [Myxococcota bacterium]|nr:hypothetical protein [Myxococcota bacterium]
MADRPKDQGFRPPRSDDRSASPEVQARYRAVRAAILEVLPFEEPGLTLKEIDKAIAPLVPRHLFPKGPGFYSLAVRVHLESIGLVVQVERSRPTRHLQVDIDLV